MMTKQSTRRPLDGVDLRTLHLYAAGRYLSTPASGNHRSISSQATLTELEHRGLITVEGDVNRGPITVTDAGREYVATHPVR